MAAGSFPLFFLALALLGAAGVSPLLLHRWFRFMQAVFTVLLVAGCGCGLFFAGHLLFHGATVTVHLPFLHAFTLALRVDPLAAFFLLPIFLIPPLAAVYGCGYLDDSRRARRTAVNGFFFAMLVATMALVACADTMLTFVLAWEGMSLTSFFLVMYDFEKKKVRQAGYLYLLFEQGGAFFIFLAFALLYHHTGSLAFDGIGSIPDGVKALVFTLAFIGFGSKAGIMPLHVWLPHAHPAAPSHVSAIMSGVMIKMGVYGIIRTYSLLQPQGFFCPRLVICVAAVTGVFGVVYALGQHDLKRLLAYSSVENIGIILLGLGTGMLGMAEGNQAMAFLGFGGGLLHVLNHALFKSLLFMGAGAVLHSTGTLRLDRLGGLMKRMPVCGVTFLIGSLAICGLPLFNGFVSEFLIYFGAFAGVNADGPQFLLTVLAILSLAVIGGLAVACFTKVVGVVFLGEPRTRDAEAAHPAGLLMRWAMIFPAFACVFIGFMPHPVITMASRAVSSLMPDYQAAVPAGVSNMASTLSGGAIGFALLLLALLILRRLIHHGPAPRIETWGCGFSRPNSRMQYSGSSFAASILHFYRPFVRIKEHFTGVHGLFPATSFFHSETIDISEEALHRGVARPVLGLTGKLRWLQHGQIQLYIGYIFLAMLGLLVWLVV
ncbi:MAG: proton-conducting transporter membrane subunit [Desulfobulbaceae bacterium]